MQNYTAAVIIWAELLQYLQSIPRVQVKGHIAQKTAASENVIKLEHSKIEW